MDSAYLASQAPPPPYEATHHLVPAPTAGSVPSTSTANGPPILVAVFGKTGTGKTSFIKSVTGWDLKIGHGLESCTDEVIAVPYDNGEQQMLLIDTPGFDDTNLSDTEILSRIADWMKYTYDGGKRLSGIIYLHRISDQRMDGASMKNLRMFRSLCGQNNLRNVILATTMWEKIGDAEGAAREEQLIGTFWKPMIDNGSIVRRISTNPEDSKRLVKSFLSKETMVLRLQEELSSGKKLLQTDAGLALKDEIDKITKKYAKELASAKEEMKQAYRTQNKQLEKQLKMEIDEVNRKMEILEKEKEALAKAVPAALPKASRAFLDSKWHCLSGCGKTTTTAGKWTCKNCQLTQKNIRY